MIEIDYIDILKRLTSLYNIEVQYKVITLYNMPHYDLSFRLNSKTFAKLYFEEIESNSYFFNAVENKQTLNKLNLYIEKEDVKDESNPTFVTYYTNLDPELYIPKVSQDKQEIAKSVLERLAGKAYFFELKLDNGYFKSYPLANEQFLKFESIEQLVLTLDIQGI